FGDVTKGVETTITMATVVAFFDWERGSKEIEQALDLARASGQPHLIAHALHDLALTAAANERPDDTHRWLDPGLTYCDEFELDLWRLALLSIRVRHELDTGRWTEATETAAVIAAEIRDSPEPLMFAKIALALVRARRGDPDTRPLLAEAA